MRRIWAILVVVALAFAAAVSAGAAPPDCSDPNTSHPSCKDDGGNPHDDGLDGGWTCLERVKADSLDGAYVDSELPVTNLAAGTYCVDVSNVEPGKWNVYLTQEAGSFRSVIVQARDSVAPGDLCDDERHRKPSPLTSPVVLDVPVFDVVNACGTDWAEVIDGVDVWKQTGEQHPLVLLVFMGGSKDFRFDLDLEVIPQP